ncbi:hypothetical protein [Actinoplanes sp. NPDC026670]|uniref:hypothetical protein n=1 Tax=Actinoplanes sp. NPDC026670 TaxID=3154700 RepID=UPI00340A950C
MGRKIDKHTVTVDGREMVALQPADYERLDASRRQIGARTARVTRLNQQLRDAQERLAQIEAAIAEAGSDECVCDRVAAILHEPAKRRGDNQRTRGGSR